MSQEQQFIETLRRSGERVTSARLTLFKILLHKSPIGSTTLVEAASRNAIDPATTYRTLQLLKQLGMVNELVLGGQRMLELSEQYGEHHHHFWCTSCGHLRDFDNQKLEAAIHRTATEMGVAIRSHQLEMTGLCKQCQQAV